MRLVLALTFFFNGQSAPAHDQWVTGALVPGWIKNMCCGQAEAHRVEPQQVTRNQAGDYIVDIYPAPIPARLALPSPDGAYWLFFAGDAGVGVTPIRCFFAPLQF